MLIEVKVKTSRIIDDKVRKRVETYILNKEFFFLAEVAVTALLTNDSTVGDFEILSLKVSQIKEIDEQTISDTLPSFIATLIDIFHEDDGTEKRLRYKVLLWAENLTAANHRANELSHQGYDMLIESIKQVDYEYLYAELNTENNQEESTNEQD